MARGAISRRIIHVFRHADIVATACQRRWFVGKSVKEQVTASGAAFNDTSDSLVMIYPVQVVEKDKSRKDAEAFEAKKII